MSTDDSDISEGVHGTVFDAFCRMPLVRRLLKNNTILYGGATREALSGSDVEAYLRSRDGAVVGWSERRTARSSSRTSVR